MRNNIFYSLLVLLGGIMLLFIVAPIMGMAIQTSFPQLQETLVDKEAMGSIVFTLSVSFITTLIVSVFAIPLSYYLARRHNLFTQIVQGIVDLPIIIPHSAAGIALLSVVSRHSFLGKIAEDMGISIIGSPIGVGVAMAFVSVPYLINAAKDGFTSNVLYYEKTAKTLGASPLKIFFSISIPLAWRNILSGLILMFARGISEFGAVVIIAFHPMVTPTLIFERFNSFGLNYARPISLVFIIICLCIFLLFRKFTNLRSNGY